MMRLCVENIFFPAGRHRTNEPAAIRAPEPHTTANLRNTNQIFLIINQVHRLINSSNT
jgi:hypothetical protein